MHLIEPLTAQAFAPYGDVIEAQPVAGGTPESINAGTTSKYPDLAELTLAAQAGRPAVHLYQADPCPLPHRVRLMERHPWSSQLFMPVAGARMIVIVGAAGSPPEADSLRAFISSGQQGVNYHPGVWHHPCLAFGDRSWFFVLDRVGPGEDCDFHHLDEASAPVFRLPAADASSATEHHS
ncbi:MAG: ureidoglycolate lyase [Pseudomonadota bacterium]